MQPLGILLLSPRAPQLRNVLTCVLGCSIVSTLQLHGLLWTDSPGVNCHALLQGNLPTQPSNLLQSVEFSSVAQLCPTLCDLMNTYLQLLKKVMRAPPAVQWLRFHASISGGVGPLPSQGTKTPHATWWPHRCTPPK